MSFRKYLLKFILVILVLLSGAYVIPAISISDGSEKFSGEKKEHAKSAIHELEIAFSSPSFYKLFTTKLQVIEINQPKSATCKYSALIQGYTYFGIKTENAKWWVSECGVVPYKYFVD